MTEREATAAALARHPRSDGETRDAFLLSLADTLNPLSDALAIEGEACRLLADCLKADRAYYVSIDEPRGTARVHRDFVRDGTPSLAGEHRIADFGWSVAILRRGESYAISDTQASSRVPAADRPAAAALGLVANICAPLIKRGRLVGAVCVTAVNPRNWRDSEVAIVRETGERIWAAVERARAEQALRESRADYRALFEAIGSGFCVIEMIFDGRGRAIDYRFVEANAAFERQSGLAGAVGRRIREFTPDLEPHWFERYGRVALTGEPLHVEGAVAQLDRWFDISAFRIGAPEQHRVAVLFTDISARSRDEEALRESETRQAFLLRLSDALRPLGDPAAIQRETATLLREHLSAGWSYCCEFGPDPTVVTITSDSTRDGLPSMAGRHDFADMPNVLACWQAGEIVDVEDFQNSDLLSERAKDLSRASGIASFLGVPVLKGGVLIASLVLADTKPQRWSRHARELARESAERTWAEMARARAETALRESEARLRLVGHAARIGSFDFDRINGRATCSPEYRELYGLGADVPPPGYQEWLAQVHPEERARVEAESLAAAADPACERLDQEFRIVRANDGEVRWITARTQLIRDAQGRFVRSIGAQWDVTQRRMASEALRESEARLAAAFESVPVGAAVIDTSGAAVIANAQYRRFLPSGLIPSRDPARRARWQAWDESGQPVAPSNFPGARALRGETVVPGQELLYTDDDGQGFWTSVATVPVRNEAGAVTGAVTAISDITALKRSADALRESEQRFREFGENSVDTLWIVNAASGQLEYLSPGFERMWGESRELTLADLSRWAELVHPEDREQAALGLPKLLGGENFVSEYRIVRAVDGAVRWIRDTGFPIRNEKGSVIRVAGIAQDVTDLKRAGERQSLLLGELQHRVRNTLAVVRMITRRSGENARDVADYRDRIEGRLAAFARTQTMLTRDPVKGIELRAIVADELSAHWDPGDGRVGVKGAAVRLPSRTADQFGLAIHELATNAVKHGALGNGGALDIAWAVERGAHGKVLRFDWREHVDQPLAPPKRRGFGMRLLEHGLVHDLDATVDLRFEPGGLTCTIVAPLG